MTVRYPVKGTPLPHQLLALQEANLKPAHAFYIDAGGGKTFTCISEAGLLYTQGEIDGMIVVAPNGPHRQWVTQELPRWADFDWCGHYNKAPAKMKTEFFGRPKKHRMGVLTLNYEALPTAGGQKLIADFIKIYPRFYLVLDESQKVKNPKAKRTVEAQKLGKCATHRRILSGTPILKGLEDLFSQYYILQAGLTGPFAVNTMSANWFGCRSYYCQLEQVHGRGVSPHAKKIAGYKNEQEFRDRVRPYSTRVTSDMFMKSEEPLRMTVETEMSGAQKSAYGLMKAEMLAMIDSGVVTASTALVQLGKLMQIASGFIMDEERKVSWLGDNKIEATLTLLESLDEPVIIWTPFVALKQRLHEEIGGSILYEKPEDVDIWKRKGGAIIGNQGSGLGVGMNLQNAAANIYTANSFSSEARWQSEKRTDRMGQTRLVRYWDLITPNTAEVKAVQSLADKEDIAAKNINGLKDMVL